MINEGLPSLVTILVIVEEFPKWDSSFFMLQLYRYIQSYTLSFPILSNTPKTH